MKMKYLIIPLIILFLCSCEEAYEQRIACERAISACNKLKTDENKVRCLEFAYIHTCNYNKEK